MFIRIILAAMNAFIALAFLIAVLYGSVKPVSLPIVVFFALNAYLIFSGYDM